MNIGDIFYVKGVVHVVTVTEGQGNVVKRAEPLAEYIERTRTIQYKGQIMTVSDMIKHMCDEYIEAKE